MRAMTVKPLPALALLATLAGVCGCAIIGPPADPIATVKVPGNDPKTRALVVVLPGFIYDADDLRDVGVADAVHRGWPGADVLLVSATYSYYRTGVLVSRLHDQVIQPARDQGYTEIWLSGGSMGGMGVLLYEVAHPGELAGLVLMSPYLGSDRMLKSIREAGLANWDPGTLEQMDGANYQQHVWNMIKGWRMQTGRVRRVWLACGTEDRLFPDVQLLAPEIPPDQYFATPGAHNWDFWLPAVENTFRAIAARRSKGS
jgi:hypothetical protein